MAVGGGGHVIPKGIVIGPFNYDEQNGYIKILIGRFRGKYGEGGGLAALQSFWSLKKGTRAFNFCPNEPSNTIQGPQSQYDHPWKKQQQINTILWPYF